MVDLSIVFSKRLPEAKPQFSYGFSYGFPMVFPAINFHFQNVYQVNQRLPKAKAQLPLYGSPATPTTVVPQLCLWSHLASSNYLDLSSIYVHIYTIYTYIIIYTYIYIYISYYIYIYMWGWRTSLPLPAWRLHDLPCTRMPARMTGAQRRAWLRALMMNTLSAKESQPLAALPKPEVRKHHCRSALVPMQCHGSGSSGTLCQRLGCTSAAACTLIRSPCSPSQYL